MTDIEQLKYIVENGTCQIDILCRECPLNYYTIYNSGSILCSNKSVMIKKAKELLNELRIKKLKRIIND